MDSKRITTENDLKIAFQIRKEVFVEEQGFPLESEFDEFDTLNALSEHILVYYNEKPVGTGRLRVVDGLGKLERICILEPYRKFGLGKIIIKTLEEIANKRKYPRLNYMGKHRQRVFIKNLAITLHPMSLWKMAVHIF